VSREDIVAIASRLFAIFLVITTIRLLGPMFLTPEFFSSTGQLLLFVSMLVLPALAVAALLWFFPLSVARKLLPVMREPRPTVSPSSQTALELALVAIGMWVLASAISDSVYWVVMLVHVYNSTVPVEIDASQTARIVATITELLLGCWLVFGSRGLANLVTRLRYLGARQADESAL
jgi:hypothetical protein